MIDKDKLIGSCVQLSRHFDVDRLRAEVDSIPAELWGEYRSEEQREAVAVFLKGYPPVQFKPDEDRPILGNLPYIRHILYEALPGTPRKCLVARMPPLSKIHLHVDGGVGMEEYFTSTLRLHVPVSTNSDVYFYIDPRFFTLAPRQLWVINNRVDHGIINDHPRYDRVHLIVDVDPDDEAVKMIDAGWRPAGVDNESCLRRLRDAASSPRQIGTQAAETLR